MHPREAVFQARFTQHTGALVFWQNSSRTYTGTYAQICRAYKAAQLHCYLAGWWSLISPILNLVAIFGNRGAMAEVRSHVEAARAQGYYVAEPDAGPSRSTSAETAPPERLA